MLIEVDENVVVTPLLRAFTEFDRFYHEEREKKLGFIRWLMKLDFPDGIEAYSDPFIYAIYYKKSPISANDAHTIAHEIMHLIRYQETDILEIIPANPSVEPLIPILNSMLEDPIVDKTLQEQYNFDLCIPYREGIKYDIKNLKEESTDLDSILIKGINITKFMLLWDLITDQPALDEWHQHLEWLETKYPHCYKIAMEIKPVVDSIGLGTIDQQREIVLKLIDMYNLGNMISIPDPNI